MELWLKHPKYRRLEVSSEGNVRTVWDHKVKPLKPMEKPTTVGSYLIVSVTDVSTGKQEQVGIHNLVAEMHVEKPDGIDPALLVPNHDDGDKHNNRASNIQWMTQQQNLQHAIDTGLRVMVTDAGKCKYIDKSKRVKVTNLSTNETVVYSSAKEAAHATGIAARTVQYNAFSRKTPGDVSGYRIEKE